MAPLVLRLPGRPTTGLSDSSLEDSLDWRTAVRELPNALDPFATHNVPTSSLNYHHTMSAELQSGDLDKLQQIAPFTYGASEKQQQAVENGLRAGPFPSSASEIGLASQQGKTAKKRSCMRWVLCGIVIAIFVIVGTILGVVLSRNTNQNKTSAAAIASLDTNSQSSEVQSTTSNAETPTPSSSSAAPTSTDGLSLQEQSLAIETVNYWRPRYEAAPLVWNATLKDRAHSLAQTCAMGKSDFVSGDLLSFGHIDIADSLRGWFFQNATLSEPSEHAQIVWQSTRSFGCSQHLCENLWIRVCSFNPVGNIEGAFESVKNFLNLLLTNIPGTTLDL